MKLKEFYGSRGRLENEGIEALSEVFKKQKSLVKIEIYQSGIKKSIGHLFTALQGIQTIEHVDVNDNIIKRQTDELCLFIKTSLGLKYLNLSDSLIKKQ